MYQCSRVARQSGGTCHIPPVNPATEGRKPPNVTMKLEHSQAKMDLDNIVHPLCNAVRETRGPKRVVERGCLSI